MKEGPSDDGKSLQKLYRKELHQAARILKQSGDGPRMRVFLEQHSHNTELIRLLEPMLNGSMIAEFKAVGLSDQVLESDIQPQTDDISKADWWKNDPGQDDESV